MLQLNFRGFFVLLEALCDKSYCDSSLLLHCGPKCTQWCYSTRAWSSCPPQWSTALTACCTTSLNELWSRDDCWSASLSALFPFVVPRRLCFFVVVVVAVAARLGSRTENHFQLRVLHFSCTPDLIMPLPCLTLLCTEVPLFYSSWKHTRTLYYLHLCSYSTGFFQVA